MSHIVTYGSKEAWLSDRENWIGASESAAILGVSPWQSALSVYARKLGLEEVEETEAMEWGTRLEGVIANAFADKTGRTVEYNTSYQTHVHPEHEFIRATLDGTTYAADGTHVPTPLGHGVLEVKTANAYSLDEWESEIPLYYQIQVQHQLLVTGRQWGSVAALIGGQAFRWGDIERHDQFIDTVLLPALKEFWRRVEEQDPPPADDSTSSAKALHLLHNAGDVDLEPVVLGSEFLGLDEERQSIGDRIKTLEKRKRHITNMLKQAITGHKKGVMPNGVAFEVNTVGPSSHEVQREAYTTIRRIKPKGEKA